MKCNICQRLLSEEEWTDDDEYGDVHVRCLNTVVDEDDT